METLTKILEKLGKQMAWAGWMYGMPVYRHALYSTRPPKDGR